MNSIDPEKADQGYAIIVLRNHRTEYGEGGRAA